MEEENWICHKRKLIDRRNQILCDGEDTRSRNVAAAVVYNDDNDDDDDDFLLRLPLFDCADSDSPHFFIMKFRNV